VSARGPAGGGAPSRGFHEHLFRTLEQDDHVGLWQVSPDGRTLWMNRGMMAMLGVVRLDDVVGKSFRGFFTADSLARMDVEIAKRTRGESSTYEAEMISVSGESRHVLISGSPMHDDEAGVRSLLGTFLDVTELRVTQRALRDSEAKYRRFFLEDLTGNFVSTVGGRIVDCNPAYARIFGYDSVEEMLAVDARALYPDEASRTEYLARLERVGSIRGLEVELRRRDGTPVWVVENVHAEYDAGGRIAGVRGYLFDVTERRRLEEQLLHSQKMEAVGRLAGGVAHDFNNTLTALLGSVDLLDARLAGDPRAGDTISDIRAAVEDAVSLTRQLLAFSRRQVLRPEILDPNAVVIDVETMLRRVVPESIRFTTGLASDLPRVRADRSHLRQVLINLAVNARDAMPDGGTLAIETRPVAIAGDGDPLPPGRYAAIAIRDTGHGMDEGVLARVFEPFFSTKDDGGTGLGLATAYGIVRQSGGDLRATSAPGDGATFEVLLPAADTPPPAEIGDDPAAPPPAGRGETLLLVEDEDSVRDVVAEILEAHGYRVLVCRDGEEALAVAAAHEGAIDLMLSDVVMPGLNGRELAERIRPTRPAMKILFMSGYTQDAVVRQGVREGDVEFIAKPFRAAELAVRVREVLDR